MYICYRSQNTDSAENELKQMIKYFLKWMTLPRHIRHWQSFPIFRRLLNIERLSFYSEILSVEIILYVEINVCMPILYHSTAFNVQHF